MISNQIAKVFLLFISIICQIYCSKSLRECKSSPENPPVYDSLKFLAFNLWPLTSLLTPNALRYLRNRLTPITVPNIFVMTSIIWELLVGR